jgi:hypothetical protein
MAAPHACQIPGVNPFHRIECGCGVSVPERCSELRDGLTLAIGDVYQRRASSESECERTSAKQVICRKS